MFNDICIAYTRFAQVQNIVKVQAVFRRAAQDDELRPGLLCGGSLFGKTPGAAAVLADDIADAVLALPTWRQSKGARREIAYAKEKGKRIFYSHAGFHELTKRSMK